jgi:GT2 family glycosyltransferase
VDNNSDDDSTTMIQREFPDVHLIRNRENVGFARANNQALKEADGDYYLLLNSDTIIPKGAVTGMLNYMENHPEVAAVGPKMTNGRMIQHSFTPLPSIWGELKYCLTYHFFPFGSLFGSLFFKSDKTIENINQPIEVELLSAACLMIRKDVLEKVGLLSEEYFLFSEENDYFHRMKKAGYKSQYLPQLEITHLIGKSREKRLSIDSEINFLKSRLLYFRKFHPGSVRLLKIIYRLFFGWSRLLASLSKILKGEDKFAVLYSKLIKTVKDD